MGLSTFDPRIHWLWIPWVPFGALWGHCGSPWPPLGTILDDFCIVLGPSDHKKSPEGDEFKMLGVVFLFCFFIYSVSLDNGSTDVSLWF